MDWLERAIEAISPALALDRAQRRHRLQAYRLASDATLRRIVRDKGGPHTQVERSGAKLRDWGRHLARNNPTVQAICRDLSLRTSHNRLVPMARDTRGNLAARFNQDVSALWERHKDELGITGLLTYGQLRQAIGHSYVRDGEIYIQQILGSQRLSYPGEIPLALAPLEGDYLPYHLEQTSPIITQGVETTKAGLVVAYHFFREHPSDGGSSRFGPRMDTVRIPAEAVMSLINIERIGQYRGLSMLAPSGETAADIDEYLEAERIAMKMCAAIGLQITRSPDAGTPQLNTDGQRAIDFEPGMVLDSLRPGEKAEMLAHTRPTTQFAEYLRQAYRGMAAGVGANYSSITNDFDGSYSSQRQMLVTAQAWMEHLHSLQVARIDRPLYRSFLQGLALAGKLPSTRGVDANSLTACDCVAMPMPWIDPEKEISAAEKRIAIGVSSRQEEARKLGTNLDRIDQERSQDANPASAPTRAA